MARENNEQGDWEEKFKGMRHDKWWKNVQGVNVSHLTYSYHYIPASHHVDLGEKLMKVVCVELSKGPAGKL